MEIEIFVDAVQHEPVGAGRKMRRLTPAEVHQRAKSFRANWLTRELGDPSQEPHVAHVLTSYGRNTDFSVPPAQIPACPLGHGAPTSGV